MDQSLDSNKFIKPLKVIGIHVEPHHRHLALNAEDDCWIRYAACKGWILVTADKGIRRTQRRAIIQAQAKMLYLHQKRGLPIEKLAANFVNTFPEIKQFFEECSAPCLVSLRHPSDYRAGGPGTVHEIALRE